MLSISDVQHHIILAVEVYFAEPISLIYESLLRHFANYHGRHSILERQFLGLTSEVMLSLSYMMFNIMYRLGVDISNNNPYARSNVHFSLYDISISYSFLRKISRKQVENKSAKARKSAVSGKFLKDE